MAAPTSPRQAELTLLHVPHPVLTNPSEITSVNHFPEEDSKLRATAVQHRRGGNCPNTLQVFRQLLLARHQQQDANDDVKIHLVSPLPRANSAATLEILSSFFDPDEIEYEPLGLTGTNTRGGITTSFRHCLYRDSHDEPASSYIVRSSTTGSRTIINFNGLPEMTTAEFVSIVDEITKEADGDSGWWHFEVRNQVPWYERERMGSFACLD